MNATALQTFISSLILASALQTYVPTVIWAEAGVGKSQNVEQAAKRAGIGFVDLRLGTMEPGDLMGLPDIVDGKTINAVPEWWPEAGTRGILFLDELNRAHRDVIGAAFQLVLDRRLMTHELPDGWIVLAACNPATADYDVNDSYDKAWTARFCHVSLTPTKEEWLGWAEAAGLHWSVRTFCDMHPGLMGLDACALPKIHPTPRTVAMLGTLLDAGLPESLHMEVATGLIGADAAAVWGQVLVSQERHLTGLAALTDAGALATLAQQTADGRVDLLQATLDEIVVITDGEDWTPDMFPALVEIIKVVPADLGFRYLKINFARNPKLIDLLGNNMDLVEWAEAVSKLASA